MNVETLNCPNCGAAVSGDAARCIFCKSRLKTVACPACLRLIFLGSEHCTNCGAKTVKPQIVSAENLGDCPRCQVKLSLLQIEEISLRECAECDGLWSDAATFENICASRESQAAVLSFISTKQSAVEIKRSTKISYVPCPDCRQLMNRNNFASSSGAIIDLCKQHGVWFDAEELPKIIEFVRRGGLDHARQKEKIKLEDEKSRLHQQQLQLRLERNRFIEPTDDWDSGSSLTIREFVRFLFD